MPEFLLHDTAQVLRDSDIKLCIQQFPKCCHIQKLHPSIRSFLHPAPSSPTKKRTNLLLKEGLFSTVISCCLLLLQMPYVRCAPTRTCYGTGRTEIKSAAGYKK